MGVAGFEMVFIWCFRCELLWFVVSFFFGFGMIVLGFLVDIVEFDCTFSLEEDCFDLGKLSFFNYIR